MLWLSRPPYLRWGAAAILLLISIVLELRPPSTVPHPFLVRSVEAGEVVEAGDIEWRQVPAGLLPPVELPTTARAGFAAGDPLLVGGTSTQSVSIPRGWWALELPAPAGALPGMAVKVVVARLDQGTSETPGAVVGLGEGDGFGPAPALVAVPEEAAAEVAVAAGEGRVTVLLSGNVP